MTKRSLIKLGNFHLIFSFSIIMFNKNIPKSNSFLCPSICFIFPLHKKTRKLIILSRLCGQQPATFVFFLLIEFWIFLFCATIINYLSTTKLGNLEQNWLNRLKKLVQKLTVYCKFIESWFRFGQIASKSLICFM